MPAFAGLHFQKRGTTVDAKAGSASSSGILSMVLPPPLPPGKRLVAFEPRAQGKVLRAGSRGLRCWEI